MLSRLFLLTMSTSLWVTGIANSLSGEEQQTDQTDIAQSISYFTQIRPILQASCQGCHQPAKSQGDYVMTSFDAMVAGGESGEVAIEPGDPSASLLMARITPVDGEAEMPPEGPPLADAEIDLIRRWVEQGAKDDTPENVTRRYDAENPPIYRRPPVVTSLDYSPDGRMLASSGFHEVFLLAADGSVQVGRLIGLSERIESVRFSPDGAMLAVAGGLPGRMGEIQIWELSENALKLSVPTTFDTVYGGSWSPDGTRIAYGGSDNSVRALDAETGEELVFMAAHDDWVRDTIFSPDGKSIFSVSRDKTVKQTDFDTQRFIGNVTTHTPGVLQGGMIKVAKHPSRQELLVGGADGKPKLFKMATKAAPASGGNPNQIREYYALPGRLFAVAFSPDGNWCYAGSSLDGAGQVRGFETDSGKELWKLDLPESGIFALAVRPDGNQLAAAGADGLIRLIDAASGKIATTFNPVDLEVGELPSVAPEQQAATAATAATLETPLEDESKVEVAVAIAPAADEVVILQTSAEESVDFELKVLPESLRIDRPIDKAQLLASALSSDGSKRDVTRNVAYQVEGNVGTVSANGVFVPENDGTGQIIVELEGQRVAVPVEVTGMLEAYRNDFIRDVNPVLTKLGCNMGTCHGAQKGQNGFKLSLRGYDAVSDVRAFTDDLASRRVNFASPDDSLMLLKPTGGVPHQGGQLMKFEDPYYRIVRDWIADGALLDRESPRVVRVEVFPKNPVVDRAGEQQQMRVVATYADGQMRDVTAESFLESGNTEVATTDGSGLMTAVRRGESAILVRYEGSYAATTLTVMGDRTEFVWEEPEVWGKIDALVADKWERMKIQPASLSSDTDFIRRVTLDLTGLPPTPDEVRGFLADTRDGAIKRTELVNQLIGSEDFIEYWTNKWADLLQVNSKFLGSEGAMAFRDWIRGHVDANTPYDEFAHEVITASGSNKDNPAASYYKILREPTDMMENTTHLFLAVRFNCNKCHDHPFERWTQDQYYETAAYFARLDLQPDPAAGKMKIGGTAVEDAKPLYEIVADKTEGDIEHERTGEVTAPKFPFDCEHSVAEGASRREQLASWITSPDNQYFARSYVNRLWGYLLGVGIIEPIDDIRAGNPATNPELLQHLTDEFIRSDFDIRHIMRLICTSRTYQLSVATNRWNEDDGINYSHALARRLPAEVLYDAVHRVTGAVSNIPGLPPGTRAAAIPDAATKLPDGFLTNMGRPARESACECERSSDMQLGGVISFVGGPTVGDAISDSENALAALVAEEEDDARLISEIFLRILSRPATAEEVQNCHKMLAALPSEHDHLAGRLQTVEQEAAARQAKLQGKRDALLGEAKNALATQEEEAGPREQELIQQREQKIDAAKQSLADFDAHLPVKLQAFEKRWSEGNTSWSVLAPEALSATNGSKLEAQDDLSVFASGKNGKGAYRFSGQTPIEGITGIRIEVIADERLPQNGPGRANNGNFVLSELELLASPNTDLAGWEKVKAWDLAQAAEAKVWSAEEGAEVVLGKDSLAVSGDAVQVETTLTDWYSLGPFYDPNAFDVEFGPEAEPVNLKQTFDVDGKAIRWKPRSDLSDGRKHTYSPGDYSATYFYRTVDVTAPRKMVLRFGSDDGIKVWLNGEEVHSNKVNRGVIADQDLVPVMLKKGENHLLLKVSNGEGPSGFYFATDTIPAINPAIAVAAEGVPGSYAVEVVARSDREAPARLFWKTKGDKVFSGRRVTEEAPLAKGGDWQTYRFDFVSPQPISGLRFDPAGANVNIREVRLYRHELPKKVAFQNAQASYQLDSHRVGRVIDGEVDDYKGWASDPGRGQTLYASFETKEDVGFRGGAKLDFLLDQQYQSNQHSIGRFRLSVTGEPRPVLYGIPPEIVKVVKLPLSERSEEDKKRLEEFYKNNDSDRIKLKDGIKVAEQPMKVDKEIMRLRELRNRVAVLQKPLPKDPQLVELERAIDLSRRQLDNQRLTVAQDIAWALINNPAFLFNR